MSFWGRKISYWVLLLCFFNLSISVIPAEAANRQQRESSDLWKVMATHFKLAQYNSAVRFQMSRYLRDRVELAALTRNARPFVYYVYQQAMKRGMPAEVALIPIIESNYDPYANSYKSAVGLWQIRAEAAQDFGLEVTRAYDGRRDIGASTQMALDYLQWLHSYLKDWSLAIAAYNSGPGVVMNAIRKNRRYGLPTDFWHLALPQQTKDYVPKLYALSLIVRSPSRYGVQLTPTPNRAYFASVRVKRPMNLVQLAALSGTEVSLIRKLNAGFRRHDVSLRNQEVRVPVEKAEFMRLADASTGRQSIVKS